ncbi:hypothetical protein DSCA_27540 [Desulfosarcina alkanivorans]|uniref:Peptidoglycan binding-like domain-containing protein n=1 Tax=Desulfosarcina alkanivorans TaxID=571177 RepID=A0A5K7YRA6_9BACT|nr:peptidoglycan-binding domain-containing protein [Desulfosarcina alkanivorans]BBO68824.1 hypothetical protein DSCA_27540 [Desulfosarcina alkanivorans]
MKSNAHRIFAVLLLATFSVWVGCSHNAPPELSNLQKELNEKENEINRLASENSKKDSEISLLANENSKKDNQLKAYEERIDQQAKNAAMQDASSPEASLYPPEANPGECFARVFVPPTYATASERVLTRSASERLEIVPARYEWVEEKVMVKAASERIEVIPAKYGWKEEQVLVKAASSRLEQIPAKYERVESKVLAKEAHVVWKKGRGPIEKVDNTTGEIMCLVEVPASYKTVKKTVMVTPPGTRKVDIPAEFKTVRKRVMLEPPQERTITIPAEYETVKVRKMVSGPQERRIPVAEEYQTVTKTVKTDDGHMEWRRIMCETNVTPDVVTNIQRTLHNAGYDPGPIDGVLGRQTASALKSYQRDHRMAEGGLTYETVKKLGITL